MAIVTGTQRARNWSGSCSAGAWGNWGNTATVNFEEQVVVKTKTGSSSGPGWRRLRNSGAILPVLGYSVSTVTTTRRGTTGKTVVGTSCPGREVENNNFYYTGFESAPSGWKVPDPTQGDVAGAVNSAISDSSSGVMQLGVTALEAKQTMELLKTAAKRLYDIWKLCIRNGRVRGIAPNQLWLEYRYAWLPLYYELRGALEAFNGSFSKGERRRGTGRRELSGSERQSVSTNLGTLIRTVDYSLEWSTKIHGFALSQVESQTMAKYGLNPVTTAWEKITFSFLIDWIWDIGSWLSTLSMGVSGFKLVSSGYSIKTVSTFRATVNFRGTGNTTGAFSGQMFEVKTEKFSRSAGGGGGLPSLNLHLSDIHLADLAALIKGFAR